MTGRIPTMAPKTLLQRILKEFRLDPWGHHGVRHWARVRANGRLIAKHEPGVDLLVLDLFAILHDWQRHDEDEDPEHGWRGRAKLATIRRWLPPMTKQQYGMLEHAIELHNQPDGWDWGSPAIAACWNADRLDLGRVGITPDRRYLAPSAMPSVEIIAKAHQAACRERIKQRNLHETHSRVLSP